MNTALDELIPTSGADIREQRIAKDTGEKSPSVSRACCCRVNAHQKGTNVSYGGLQYINSHFSFVVRATKARKLVAAPLYFRSTHSAPQTSFGNKNSSRDILQLFGYYGKIIFKHSILRDRQR